jgi:hypothetical protein
MAVCCCLAAQEAALLLLLCCLQLRRLECMHTVYTQHTIWLPVANCPGHAEQHSLLLLVLAAFSTYEMHAASVACSRQPCGGQ